MTRAPAVNPPGLIGPRGSGWFISDFGSALGMLEHLAEIADLL
jgi:hypothetical protein